MELTLQDLPVELLHLTLEYLPLLDLLNFGRTSKSNRTLSIQTLTSLDLAIFPRRIHSILAFFDASNHDDDEDDDDREDLPPISKHFAQYSVLDKSLSQVGIATSTFSRPLPRRSKSAPECQTPVDKESERVRKSKSSTPPTPLSLRTAEITTQNKLAHTIVSKPSLKNLRNLTLRLYNFTSLDLATTIATSLPILQSLNLDFCHPYIHDTTLPAKYWKEGFPSGSPIWNILAGIGESNNAALRLHNLQSLRLNRSGITSFQLRHWIEANPNLRSLRLSQCRGVDNEFITWLAAYIASGRSKLETIRLTNCNNLTLQNEDDFEFITQIAGSAVRELNLRACGNINESVFVRLARGDELENRWSAIRKLVSPCGVVVRHRGQTAGQDIPGTIVQRPRLGSVSPALTVSDDMIGSCHSVGVGSGSGSCYFRLPIEVDPSLSL